jgi:hypothetical protein
MKRGWVKKVVISFVVIIILVTLGFGIWSWSWYEGVGRDIKKREQYHKHLKELGINPDSPMIFTEDGMLIQLDSNDIKKLKEKSSKSDTSKEGQ